MPIQPLVQARGFAFAVDTLGAERSLGYVLTEHCPTVQVFHKAYRENEAKIWAKTELGKQHCFHAITEILAA